MAYDSVRSRTVLFGGGAVGGPFGDTWEYAPVTPATFSPFGSGCAGTNGVDVQGTVGVPELGNMVAYTLTGGRPSSVTLLVLGSNRTNWLGLPLPLVLGTLAPGCTLYVPLDVLLSRPTTAAGAARFDVTIPTDVNLIDGHFFTQNLCLDQGANPINLTFSNAVDTKVGGLF